MSLKMIDNARGALKHFSTIALSAGAALQGAWMAFPDDLKAGLGPDAVHYVSKITALVLVWGLVGKFVKQPLADPKDPQ